MYARFLADADLRLPIIRGLKRIEARIDFETAVNANLEGKPDAEVLKLAAAKDRILVSHDRRAMASAFYEFIRDHHSPGLILINKHFLCEMPSSKECRHGSDEAPRQLCLPKFANYRCLSSSVQTSASRMDWPFGKRKESTRSSRCAPSFQSHAVFSSGSATKIFSVPILA